MAVTGNYALLACEHIAGSKEDFLVVNVSNPRSPARVSSFSHGLISRPCIEVVGNNGGNYAVIACKHIWGSGINLQVVDVSNPEEPEVIASMTHDMMSTPSITSLGNYILLGCQ